jgi:hypothetical protein
MYNVSFLETKGQTTMLKTTQSDYMIYILLVCIVCMLGYLLYDIFRRKKFSTENIGDEIPEFLKQLDINIKHDRTVWQESNIKNNNKIGAILKQIKEVTNKSNDDINNIRHSFDGLLTLTSKQDKKIRRFEEGYDYKIQVEFILGVIQAIDDLEKDNENQPTTDAIERLIILLANNSIKRFDIKIDSPYEKYKKYAEAVRTEYTNNDLKDGKVVKIEKQGYHIVNNTINKNDESEPKTIRQASVVVYKSQKSNAPKEPSQTKESDDNDCMSEATKESNKVDSTTKQQAEGVKNLTPKEDSQTSHTQNTENPTKQGEK